MNKIIIGIVVVLIVGGVYLFVSSDGGDVNVPDPYDGWEVYRDEQYGFEMQYPPEWTPRFIEGQFAGFYDASYEDWLVDFDEAVRVGFQVLNFTSIQEGFILKGGSVPTLQEYVYWFDRRTKPESKIEPKISTSIVDGRTAVRIETYSDLSDRPGYYIGTYVPTPENKIYVFNVSSSYADFLDRMISTFRITK